MQQSTLGGISGLGTTVQSFAHNDSSTVAGQLGKWRHKDEYGCSFVLTVTR
jgi:7-keto-8-aminopelargonate synthetase-like enzyme